MDGAEEVILLLKVVLLAAPPAMYFVVLGLLNSRATPHLVNARTDFLLLTAAVGPVLLAPVPAVVRSGYGWALLLAAATLALALGALLPRRDGGWVIYNLSGARARALIERCLRELRWPYDVRDGIIEVPERTLHIRLSVLPVLRNVTCHLVFGHRHNRSGTAEALRRQLAVALARQEQLPSLAASCLVLVGISLLMLPLWMMTRHCDAVAEVFSRLLPI